MSLGLDIDTSANGWGQKLTSADRLEAWRSAIKAADTLAAISEVSALMGHKISVARRRGYLDPAMWRDAYRLLHERRDALLDELCADRRQASGGASVANWEWE